MINILVVGESGDLSVRLPMKRNDEIGILTGEFDNMLEQIEKKIRVGRSECRITRGYF